MTILQCVMKSNYPCNVNIYKIRQTIDKPFFDVSHEVQEKGPKKWVASLEVGMKEKSQPHTLPQYSIVPLWTW